MFISNFVAKVSIKNKKKMHIIKNVKKNTYFCTDFIMRNCTKMKIRGLYRIFFIISLMLFSAVRLMAQTIDLIPEDRKTITGNATQQQFSTAAPLLYGMPFELSLDVEVPTASSDSAPSYNQWGSSILTSGTDPFATPQKGFQIYQRCKGNGGQLIISIDGAAYTLSEIQYSDKYYNVHLIQSNGQLTVEVAKYTNWANKTKGTPRVFTRSIFPNRIDKLSYALPSGMNVSSLSLTVRSEDLKNYVNNILPKGVGYLSQEARDYICEHIDGQDGLDVYKSFIGATVLDGAGNFGQIDGKRSYQLPEIGKVYTIRGVCQDNTYYLVRDELGTNTFGLTSTAPNASDYQHYFNYLWSPREKSRDRDDRFAFYHATGAGQYLLRNGLSATGTSLANAQEWELSNGTEAGRVAIYGTFSNGNRYMAMSRQGNKLGDWPANGGVYSKRQNDNSWSTDFIFEEVPTFSAYELIVTGPQGFDASGKTVRYRQKIAGTAEHYTGENEGIVADITAGGLVFVNKDYEEASGICRLSISDFTPQEVSGYVSVVTLGSGVVYVEYTQFSALKDKAQAEVTAAQNRLKSFKAGALYTQAAINAANEGIAAAQTLFDGSNPKAACEKLEQTMEAFYMTIDGRYVIMENGTGESETFLSTTGATNLTTKKKVTDATGNYFGVYQLHYISGGAYQLRNAYVDNYVGQTTSAATVNSASNTVASRWRGTYTFNLVKTGASEDAYNLVCTNGASNTMLGAATNVAKVAVNETNNLWDVRLVDVKTYAEAYRTAISEQAFNEVIGHAPSTAVKNALVAAIGACPDRSAPDVVNPTAPTTEQETTLAGAVNHYIDHKDDINKPANGQYVTFVNRSATKYIGENLYEMKAADAIDLGCVWKTVVEGDKYYFQNAKTGMFMGKVTQSAVGRLTTKNNGANKQEIDIIAAPGRADNEGYVVLHEMGTNNYRSYIHYSSDRNAIVGWSTDAEATHWTINAVAENDTFVEYIKNATISLGTMLHTDVTEYPTGHSGYYEKTADELSKFSSTDYWDPVNIHTVSDAFDQYNSIVGNFNEFTNLGEKVSNNSMLLIKTKNITVQSTPGNFYITQVLDDGNNETTVEIPSGSMTNAVPTNVDNFYLFSLWQLIKDGEYYKLYNFYTRHYLSKDISLSNEALGRYGLTTDPDEAATFIIKPEHGCYVSLQRSDYEEMNNGFLYIQSFAGSAKRIDNGFINGSAPAVTTGDAHERVLFSLEPATTDHLEKCLESLLNYPIGPGLGQYTDANASADNSYANEVAKLNTIFLKKGQSGYENELKTEAQRFAPTLAGLRINLPQAGHYYRLYNIAEAERWYMTSAATGSYPIMTQAAGEDAVHATPTTVFYFDGEHLLAYGNGYYIGNGSTPWVMGGVGQNYLFKFANTGYTGKGCYSIKPQGRSYLYNNKASGLNGWGSAFNAGCEWYLEEVTDLPLVVSAAGYATLVSGRTHRIPSGVKCYVAETAVLDNGTTGAVNMERITDGILPANVPVLVKADQGTYYFTEPSSLDGLKTAADYQSNIFVGDLETVYSGYSAEGGVKNYQQYTLQKPSGKQTGFYLYTGSTLRGFSANLPIENVAVPAQGAKPTAITFRFREDTPTDIGVKELERSNTNTAVYDLMGRRITTPTRGLYLARGKKIVIKH